MATRVIVTLLNPQINLSRCKMRSPRWRRTTALCGETAADGKLNVRRMRTASQACP